VTFPCRHGETRSEKAGVAAPRTHPTSEVLDAARRSRRWPDLRKHRSKVERHPRSPDRSLPRKLVLTCAYGPRMGDEVIRRLDDRPIHCNINIALTCTNTLCAWADSNCRHPL